MSGLDIIREKLRNFLEKCVNQGVPMVASMDSWSDDPDSLDPPPPPEFDISTIEMRIEQMEVGEQSLMFYVLKHFLILDAIILNKCEFKKEKLLKSLKDFFKALQWQYINSVDTKKVFTLDDENNFLLSGFIVPTSRGGDIVYTDIEKSIQEYFAEELSLEASSPELFTRILNDMIEVEHLRREVLNLRAENQSLRDVSRPQVGSLLRAKSCLKPRSEIEKLKDENRQLLAAFNRKAVECDRLTQERVELAERFESATHKRPSSDTDPEQRGKFTRSLF